MKVEELKLYGKTVPELVDAVSLGTRTRVGLVVMRFVLQKFGFGFPWAMRRVSKEKKRLIREYPKAYKRAFELAKETANQFVTMTALFNVVAEKEGREEAYHFTRAIFQGYAKHTMPALYDLANLVKCEGDVYENYCKYNIAMFRASDDYRVKEIKEEEDCLTVIVDRCVSVEIANAFECPEVGRLGCDHDVAGYPPIEDAVQSEFRRLHTIAKGDDVCDFMFFRKGTCTIDPTLNK